MKNAATPPGESGSKARGFLRKLGFSMPEWKRSNIAPAAEIDQSDAYLYGAGMSTAASLLGDGRRSARARQIIYDKWMRMEGDPIVSTALLLLCTAALGGHETNGNLVFIEPVAKAESDAKLRPIVDEIAASLMPLFNRVAFSMAYTGAAYGDAFARVYCDESGVIDLSTDELIRPQLVQAYERGGRTVGYAVYTGERNFERLDVTQMCRLKMQRTLWVPQYGVVEKALKLHVTEDDVDALPIMPSMIGGSLLSNAEEAYDNLSASLLGLVGQRWVDSIDEQIITVNLESTTKDQQRRMIESIKKILSTSKQYAEDAVKRGYPMLERIRYLIPVHNEKQVLNVMPATGGASGRSAQITIDDVMLHARLLAGALGVDLSMIGFADQLSGGLGEGGFFRVSAQAAERARVIRVALADFFNSVIDVHTLKRYGTVFRPAERPWQINFYGSISALEAEKQRTRSDAMNAGLLLVQAIQAMKDMGATEKILEEFLQKTMMLDEDQAKLYAQIVRQGGGEGAEGGAEEGGEYPEESAPAPKERPKFRPRMKSAPAPEEATEEETDAEGGEGAPEE